MASDDSAHLCEVCGSALSLGEIEYEYVCDVAFHCCGGKNHFELSAHSAGDTTRKHGGGAERREPLSGDVPGRTRGCHLSTQTESVAQYASRTRQGRSRVRRAESQSESRLRHVRIEVAQPQVPAPDVDGPPGRVLAEPLV